MTKRPPWHRVCSNRSARHLRTLSPTSLSTALLLISPLLFQEQSGFLAVVFTGQKKDHFALRPQKRGGILGTGVGGGGGERTKE